MATLGDLNVRIAASVEEAGFKKGEQAIGGIAASAQSAAAAATAAMGQIGAAADKSAQRITDAAGRVRDGYGKFVPMATLAAEAAGNVGGSLGGLSDAAGRASTSINGGLVSSFAAFDKAVKPLNEGIGRLGEGLKSAGGSLTTYVTLPLAGLAAGAVLAAAKVDSLTRGLQAVTQQQLGEQGLVGLEGIAQAATDTQTRLKELREVAKLPGLGFTEAIQGDIRLRAVGLSADLSKKALLAFGNAIATTGGGKSELDSVTRQLGQLSSKGKVLAQDLQPILSAAPAVATALRKLYGTVDSETISKSLEKQGKSSTDFINTLTDELGKLPKVTGGLAIAGENISDSLTLAGSKIGLTAEKLFDLSGIANRAGEFIEGLADKFAALDPGTQKLIFGLGAAAAAAGPLLFAIGSLGAAVPAVVAGFEVLGITSVAALGPIGLAAAGVAAALYLIYQNSEQIGQYFGSGEGGVALQNLRGSFDELTSAASEFGRALAGLSSGQSASGLAVGGLLGQTTLLKQAFQLVGDQIVSKFGLVAGALNIVNGILAGNLTTSLRGVVSVVVGLVPPLATVGRLLRKDVQEGFEGAAGGGGRFGTSLLQLSGVLTGFNTQLQGFAGGLPNYGAGLNAQSGLLERLHAQLKQLKDDQQAAGTEQAALAFNPLIDNLEKYIARLEGNSKASKAAADAIAKLRLELSRLSALDNLLGNTPSEIEVLDRRADTLAKGLRTLVDAGVNPSSKAFQGFAADLVKTSQAADLLKGSAGNIDFKPAKLTGLIPTTIGDTLPRDVARLLGDFAKEPIPFTPRLDIKPIITTDFKGAIADSILDATKGVSALKGIDLRGISAPLIEYGSALDVASKTAAIFGGSLAALSSGFDINNAKVDAARTYLQDLREAGYGPLSPVVQNAAADLRQYTIDAENARILSQGLTSGLAGLGVAIGESLAGGGDVLEAAGKAILKSLAEIGAKYGSFLIALGIGDIASGFAAAKGAAEVAAGVGLIAASTALGGFASGGGAAGSGSSLGSQPKTSYSGSASTASQLAFPKEIILKAYGRDLQGVLRLGEYRELRSR